MKNYTLTLLLLLVCSNLAFSQDLVEPCEMQVTFKISLCIDTPGCVIFQPTVQNGTPPYSYLWDRDSTTTRFLNIFLPDYDGTCEAVTITDSKGCVVRGGDIYPDNSLDVVAFPDTLVVNETPIDFDVSVNDPSAGISTYELMKSPTHGTVVFNSDGTGTYTPSEDWCGEDYFTYVLFADVCSYSEVISVAIFNEPCAGIFLKSVACNDACTGSASFYHHGIFTPPVSLLWSNGDTSKVSENLCQGPVSVTVTDALGLNETYQSNVDFGLAEISIQGFTESCQFSPVQLTTSYTQFPEGDVTFDWEGILVNTSSPLMESQIVYPGNDGSVRDYQVILRSSNGCIDTAFHQILSLEKPDLSGLIFDRFICTADTLKVNAYATGGVSPYNYAWTGPLGIQSNSPELIWPNITEGHNGEYQLVVTDENGCTDRVKKTLSNITDSVDYEVAIRNLDKTYCQGSNVKLDYRFISNSLTPKRVEWTGPDFYSEKLDPTLSNVSPDNAGIYTVTLFYGVGCSISASAELIVSSETAFITDLHISPPTACDTKDAEITVTLSIPPPYEDVDISWSGTDPVVNENPFTLYNGRIGNFDYIRIGIGGCTIEESITVPYPDIPTILTTDATCQGDDGTAEILSPNSPHISATWRGPNSTFDVLRGIRHSNLEAATYRVTILDSITNCYHQDTISINPYLDFDLTLNDIPNCTNTVGSIEVNELGNATAPVTYDWSNGYEGTLNTDLAYGWYSVTMSDGEDCQRHKNIFLPADEPCFSNISGYVLINNDCDCDNDGDDIPIGRIRVCATNGGFKDCYFTDNTGYYSIDIPMAGEFILTTNQMNDYLVETCAPAIITIDEEPREITDANFFFCGDPVSDLAVYPFCGIARPGFEQSYSFDVRNYGLIESDTALLKVNIDDNLTINSINPEPDAYDPVSNEISWDIRKMKINERLKFKVEATVNSMLGDTLITTSEITVINNEDVALDNNLNFCEQIVVGSYDPNDKQVSPLGDNSGGITIRDTSLTYTLRFQNTGSDTAFTVVLRDTLDENVFDVNSVQPRTSSHDYTLDVEGENILVFTYEDINLPDSTRSLAGSQGYVIFDIKLKNDLSLGTEIENTASIYFDFNDPVITNTTYQIVTSSQDLFVPDIALTVFPNPTSGDSNLSFDLPYSMQNVHIDIISVNGKNIKTVFQSDQLTQGGHLISFNTNNLSEGLYFISLKTASGVFTKRLVKIE